MRSDEAQAEPGEAAAGAGQRAPRRLIAGDQLGALIQTLAGSGYAVIGPTVRAGAIVYDEVRGVADLPAGWTDRQEAGRYRLERREDGALFGYAVGPHSWKRFLHPPAELLWRARRTEDGFAVEAAPPSPPRFAFLGVRACELHAIAIQDRVFLGGTYRDTGYAARREGAFVVAVNCGTAGGTCFCASMGTGPGVSAGFDLALTELVGDGAHAFLVEAGSEAGARVLAGLASQPATQAALAAAEAVVEGARAGMGRRMETAGLKELLQSNPEHPRWDDIAARCLACANCTMVCPTCFCTTVSDRTDLAGGEATREKRWDSCFTADFSFIHGGAVRASRRSRYRQWMTHKLAHWIDQFGTSGCVGCGRCITWCPVGIDITEEAAAIRAQRAGPGKPEVTHGDA